METRKPFQINDETTLLYGQIPVSLGKGQGYFCYFTETRGAFHEEKAIYTDYKTGFGKSKSTTRKSLFPSKISANNLPRSRFLLLFGSTSINPPLPLLPFRSSRPTAKKSNLSRRILIWVSWKTLKFLKIVGICGD